MEICEKSHENGIEITPDSEAGDTENTVSQKIKKLFSDNNDNFSFADVVCILENAKNISKTKETRCFE